MKPTLLATLVGLIVVIVVIFVVSQREPTAARPGQSASTAVEQPRGTTAGTGASGVVSGGGMDAQAQRGSGIEGQSSADTTTTSGGSTRELKP